MLQSFFPRPSWFFISALIWSVVTVTLWYMYGDAMAAVLGFQLPAEDAAPVIGLGHFVTTDFIWFYCYYTVAVALFYGFWRWYHPTQWQDWSILGSALILFGTYFSCKCQ